MKYLVEITPEGEHLQIEFSDEEIEDVNRHYDLALDTILFFTVNQRLMELAKEILTEYFGDEIVEEVISNILSQNISQDNILNIINAETPVISNIIVNHE